MILISHHFIVIFSTAYRLSGKWRQLHLIFDGTPITAGTYEENNIEHSLYSSVQLVFISHDLLVSIWSSVFTERVSILCIASLALKSL